MLDLARDAETLGGSAFVANGTDDFKVIVKQTLQRFGVAAAIGVIGASHQQSKVPLLAVVAREVGVDALGNVAEKRLEAGRRVKLFGFVGIAECGIMGFLRTLAGFLSSAASRVGVVEIDFALGDPCFEIVELRVEDSNLAKVAPLKGLELDADFGKLRFALRQRGADDGKLLALLAQAVGVRSSLEDDFAWHMQSRNWNFQCIGAKELGSSQKCLKFLVRTGP
jgi:hypothetical protein